MHGSWEKHARARGPSPRAGGALALALLLACGIFSGCAAITNPVANGIPVRRLPPELLGGPPREAMVTLPLNLLGQTPPDAYRLAPNDVLGVYIEGILPATLPNQPPIAPAVSFPSQTNPMARDLPPSMGYPIPVRDNGTVSLPLISPVFVQGYTVAEAEVAIRNAYVQAGQLQPNRVRMLMSLLQPRQTRVTVIRQEAGGFTSGGFGGVIATSSKRGTGHVLYLSAYKNDVLTALAETGGLPGLDDYDSIFVFKAAQNSAAVAQGLAGLKPGQNPAAIAQLCPRVIQIPTRVLPCEQLPLRPEDVILENGDVVFLEARDSDLFYTGGLLPAGEFVLPRDYDLDVVEAVVKVQGTLVNGAFTANNLSGQLVQPGIGGPSPSQLTVVRRTPGGGQVAIRVDLNRALRDPRERILVRAGDVLILQETPEEALARYFAQQFNFTVVSRVIRSSTTTGTITTSTP